LLLAQQYQIHTLAITAWPYVIPVATVGAYVLAPELLLCSGCMEFAFGANTMAFAEIGARVNGATPSLPTSADVVYNFLPSLIESASRITWSKQQKQEAWNLVEEITAQTAARQQIEMTSVNSSLSDDLSFPVQSNSVTKSTSDEITLYRGVTNQGSRKTSSGRTRFEDAKLGIAEPKGGPATAYEHSMLGDTKSPYVSWSKSPGEASIFALLYGANKGIVLRYTFKKSELVASPDRFGEQEWLVPFRVENAQPSWVTPGDPVPNWDTRLVDP
jgi:hypothetical protein